MGTTNALTFSLSDAAAAVGYSTRTLQRAIEADELQAAQLGHGDIRISRPELEAWWRNRGGGLLFAKPTPTSIEDLTVYAQRLADFCGVPTDSRWVTPGGPPGGGQFDHVWLRIQASPGAPLLDVQIHPAAVGGVSVWLLGAQGRPEWSLNFEEGCDRIRFMLRSEQR